MKPDPYKIVARSLIFYSKASVIQIIIVALLSAVITGSLFTGYSVRSSLRKTASERLGNTDIVISSGLRYFDASLAKRITESTGEKAVSLLEAEGFCQNFSTGLTALNIKIYAIGNDFFLFHGKDQVIVDPGTVAVNDRLAQYLGLKSGDEIIISFRDTNPIPANAPFAPSGNSNSSKVMKVGNILTPQQSGNFSLGISQIIPMNVFINYSDLESEKNSKQKANRLIILNRKNYLDTTFFQVLSRLLTPADIGISVRVSAKTGEPELVSDRIFIDSAIVEDILGTIPSGYPVITYLANSINLSGTETPYSFITAMPSSLYQDISEDEIIISRWLSEDLKAKVRDTLTLTWYVPGSGRFLKEKNKKFIIAKIIESNSRYLDPTLMPDFPGISGSTTCSSWDAGVPILMDKIRDKDEDYWNKYKGTPKAFITYETGKKIWGNIFGAATAIRFPASITPKEITDLLNGSIVPGHTGFTVSAARNASNKAAGEGVDFSTLFLSLGIFIVISCIILLSLAVSMFFDSRKDQIRTYFALGFRNNFIKKLLFLETSVLSLAGAIPGVFVGYFVNMLIINALNSVWSGAVQTNTLTADFSFLPLLCGLLITVVITSMLILFKVRSFLGRQGKSEKGELEIHPSGQNLIFLLVSVLLTSMATVLSLVLRDYSTLFSFLGGSFLLISFVLALRQYYTGKAGASDKTDQLSRNYSRQFYSFHPSHAIAPVIFIAAGIFAIIITGANRQVISYKMLLPAGGTGGYLLWAESAVPVKEDLASNEGRKEFGLEEESLSDLKFVQAKRLPGDDASCLNLNHVTAPPLLGIDQSSFIARGSFSFATAIKNAKGMNPWELLINEPAANTIYGIADQTVLQWGLKIKTGDTLIYKSENGQPVNIVICAGLKSSVFQGYLLIGESNFEKYFPTIAGNSIFLIDGNPELSEFYRNTLSERLAGYGISVQPAGEKLASFFQVTNTYLDVFTILGALGMILGVVGLGFILIRNFNQRKREFALMMATGYSPGRIRILILTDQIGILFRGVLAGTISGLLATLPSIINGSGVPWRIIIFMILSVSVAGFTAILLSVRSVQGSSLILQLRRE
jgi:ABC-type antimicrobial peptide transport system permease subunit